MSAWFAGSSVWAVTMYFMKDWAEVKVGVRAILIFVLGLLGVWIFASSRYELNHTDIASRQAISYMVSLVIMAAWLLYAYWKQEQAARSKKTHPVTLSDAA
jgi:undecaprenyl pyrophosphate phosphatase UppP